MYGWMNACMDGCMNECVELSIKHGLLDEDSSNYYLMDEVDQLL